MPLAAGQTLGHYEILSPLGAGGMGEVYKARDTRLDRTVAIKVLPAHLAGDPRLRERFDREARAVSGLNHPHICTLHDVGQQDGVDFLVLEYLAGESLADRLKKGALPLAEALRYASQIADALDRAHRQGVVHRDLKPGNVMITESGAKLLDFGLAKQGLSPAGPVESQLPTEGRSLTAEGSILGTLQYMAPEQLEGQEADARTDIFALGAVLYEMVTGRRAFEGKSQASLISAIMTAEPARPSTLQAVAPPLLDRVVATCLEKAPDARWQSAADVKRALSWVAEAAADERTMPVAGEARRRGRRLLAAAFGVGAVVGALLATGVRWGASRSEPGVARPVTRVPIVLPSADYFGPLNRPLLALSPDGRRLAYVARPGLFIREMDRLEATPLGDAIDAAHPFFSHDGRWVGFVADGALRKLSVRGGAPVTLCDVGAFRGASWGSDDVIVYATPAAGIFAVPAAGGVPERLVAMDAAKGETASWPQRTPDGRSVLYTLSSAGSGSAVVAHSLETGERKLLVEGGSNARLLQTGHLVYALEDTLQAVPFDVERLEPRGGAVPVLEGVLRHPVSGAFQAAFSDAGTLAYMPDASRNLRLVWVDRSGVEEPLPLPPAAYNVVQLSPDGTRLALDRIEQGSADVWLYDLASTELSRFTFDPAFDTDPVWSPDGQRIYFASTRAGARDVYSKPSDGSGEVARVTDGGTSRWPQAVTPDGATLLIDELADQMDILQLRLDGTSEPEPFLRTGAAERLPQVSPDGRLVAYESSSQGSRNDEIFVRTFPGGGSLYQVSAAGGRSPRWSRDGRELFYLDDGALVAATVETDPAFRVTGRRTLFEGPYADNSHNYAVSPDGQRFLMLRAPAQGEVDAPHIVVVENWFEELKQLAPAE